MQKTKIEWCTHTLNPVVGCTFGCEYCYARRLTQRFKWIDDYSKPQFFPERLKKLNNKNPKNIFMDSMSDIADWKEEWLKETFNAMDRNVQHNYLFLTKRPDVYKNWEQFSMSNIWCGATSTDTISTYNATYSLSHNLACNKFLSIEPLLDEIKFDITLYQMNWVIIGAETGNRKGKVVPKKEWIEKIVYECRTANVPVFMKESLLDLMGQDFIQEFPW